MNWKRVHKSLNSKSLKRIIMILSISGFMWQICVVSIQYFGYKTTTAVSFVIHDTIMTKTSVICVRYRDVIDHDRVLKETGILLTISNYTSSTVSKFVSQADDEKLTIEQILKYTPDPDAVAKRCLVPDKYGSVSKETTECSKHFIVDKFFTQTYICYRFIRKKADNYPIEAITHSDTKSYLIYAIVFSDDFWKISYVSGIVYGSKDYPHLSRNYGIRLGVRVEKGIDPNANNYFLLSAHEVASLKLPKPYDTRCAPGTAEDYFRCTKRCRIESYARINRVPGTEMLGAGYNLRPVSEADKRDNFIHESIRKFDQECKQECYFNWCLWIYSVTSVTPSRYPNASFVFSVNTAKQPDFHSRTHPVMTFIEYFSFTMGCFGIWFGISFQSLDPRKLLRYRKRIRVRRRTFIILQT